MSLTYRFGTFNGKEKSKLDSGALIVSCGYKYCTLCIPKSKTEWKYSNGELLRCILFKNTWSPNIFPISFCFSLGVGNEVMKK